MTRTWRSGSEQASSSWNYYHVMYLAEWKWAVFKLETFLRKFAWHSANPPGGNTRATKNKQTKTSHRTIEFNPFCKNFVIDLRPEHRGMTTQSSNDIVVVVVVVVCFFSGSLGARWQDNWKKETGSKESQKEVCLVSEQNVSSETLTDMTTKSQTSAYGPCLSKMADFEYFRVLFVF